MQKDYSAAIKTRGNQEDSKKLANDWVTAGKNTVRPSGIAGDRFEEVKGNVRGMYKPGGPGDKPDPELDAARQRLYGADQQKKSLDPKQRELDLQEARLNMDKENAAAQRNLERDKMKQTEEQFKADLAFKKEEGEENRKLQREQAKMQMIQSVIQILGQLITTAMQMLGQVAAAHISGQYQVQASIMQKFKN
jgi:hypothetical protein